MNKNKCNFTAQGDYECNYTNTIENFNSNELTHTHVITHTHDLNDHTHNYDNLNQLDQLSSLFEKGSNLKQSLKNYVSKSLTDFNIEILNEDYNCNQDYTNEQILGFYIKELIEDSIRSGLIEDNIQEKTENVNQLKLDLLNQINLELNTTDNDFDTILNNFVNFAKVELSSKCQTQTTSPPTTSPPTTSTPTTSTPITSTPTTSPMLPRLEDSCSVDFNTIESLDNNQQIQLYCSVVLDKFPESIPEDYTYEKCYNDLSYLNFDELPDSFKNLNVDACQTPTETAIEATSTCDEEQQFLSENPGAIMCQNNTCEGEAGEGTDFEWYGNTSEFCGVSKGWKYPKGFYDEEEEGIGDTQEI